MEVHERAVKLHRDVGRPIFIFGVLLFAIILFCGASAGSAWLPWVRRDQPGPAAAAGRQGAGSKWEVAPPSQSRASVSRQLLPKGDTGGRATADARSVRSLSRPSHSPSPRSMEPAGPHLCSELVVPEGSECTLLVPRLPPSRLWSGSSVTIDDARGVPVFKATFSLASGQLSRDAKRLALSSATGDNVFAFCCDGEAPPGGGHAGLSILHQSEVTFGALRMDGRDSANGYSVVTRRGWRIHFRGDLQAGNMNATDDQGRLLAIAEPSGSSRRSVRIGPLVDAGLITLSLLGIDLLEYEAPRSWSSRDLDS